ncbi:MAG: hypothetical protein WBO36_00010 [Saprospiraceae bacterium]
MNAGDGQIYEPMLRLITDKTAKKEHFQFVKELGNARKNIRMLWLKSEFVEKNVIVTFGDFLWKSKIHLCFHIKTNENE